jgi:hypothetical protein
MEILAAVVCISVVELVVLTVTLRAGERADERRNRAELERVQAAALSRPQFLADRRMPSERAPLDALVAQLERHMRLEQQAAESFLRNPTVESLHHSPPSPFHVTH